jgi:hypothetical protein
MALATVKAYLTSTRKFPDIFSDERNLDFLKGFL